MTIKNLISIAKIDDTDQIMNFIDNEWQKGHILSTNKEFFLYEYRNEDKLNFIISKNESNKINGMLGFLTASSSSNSTVWTTMWKVSKFTGAPMLGIELLNFLRMQGFKSVMSSGIGLDTAKIYDYFGFKVGALNHYFIPNKKIEKFKIAIIPNRIRKEDFVTLKVDNSFCKKISAENLKEDFNFENLDFQVPKKDFNFINKRYFNHPIYDYDVYGCYHDMIIKAVAIVRVSRYLNSKCLRIVDFYGEDSFLGTIVGRLKEIMIEEKHEYIDFYSFGMSIQTLRKAGFLDVKCDEKDIIIPNYFEPFVRKNVDINYFTDLKELNNLRIYKADGDQDRPNLIPHN